MAENGSLSKPPIPLIPAPKSSPFPSPPRSKLKTLLGPLSIVSYLLSLLALAVGVWLLFTRDYDCEQLLHTPRIRVAIGVGLLVLFVISNAAVFYGHRCPIPGFLVVTVLLVVMLTAGLALVGTYWMESRGVPATPTWLCSRVSGCETWSNIKACISDSQLCADLGFRTVELTSYDFSMKKISLIEDGCCKPPDLCGMEYVNATYWNNKPAKDGKNQGSEASSANHAFYGDCNAWSNNVNQLCYDCHTCKVGFLTTIHQRWRQIGVFLVVMAVFLLLAHVIRFTIIMLERDEA